MKKDRIYVDTSVIGGIYHDEFADDSRSVIEMARHGDIILLVSELLGEELHDAPEKVRAILATIPAGSLEPVFVNGETRRLLQAYMKEKIVSRRYTADAHHVAIASVHGADVLLSWNFKHIVHLD